MVNNKQTDLVPYLPEYQWLTRVMNRYEPGIYLQSTAAKKLFIEV